MSKQEEIIEKDTVVLKYRVSLKKTDERIKRQISKLIYPILIMEGLLDLEDTETKTEVDITVVDILSDVKKDEPEVLTGREVVIIVKK